MCSRSCGTRQLVSEKRNPWSKIRCGRFRGLVECVDSCRGKDRSWHWRAEEVASVISTMHQRITGHHASGVAYRDAATHPGFGRTDNRVFRVFSLIWTDRSRSVPERRIRLVN